MVLSTREAIKLARETAKEAGYKNPTVTDSTFDEDEEVFEIELEDDETSITVTINGDSGEVVDFTTS